MLSTNNHSPFSTTKRKKQMTSINDSLASFFSETESLVDAGNLTLAEQHLKELLNNQKSIQARALNDYGIIAYRQGSKEQALQYYQKAVSLAPQEPIYRKNLADLYYFEYGETHTALTHYRQILADNPQDFDANLTIGRICADLSRHFQTEAEDFFDLAEKIEPGNAQVAGERAKFYDEKLNPREERAEKHWKQSDSEIVAENKNPEEVYTRLSCEFKPDQDTETERNILMFLEKYPDFALAHNDLGVISHKQNKPVQAGRCYREAVRLDPMNSTFRKNLADFIFVIEKQPEEAMPHYHEALKINPKDIEVLMMIGNICLSLDSPDEARNFFNLVLDIEPWNIDADQALKVIEENDNQTADDTCS